MRTTEDVARRVAVLDVLRPTLIPMSCTWCRVRTALTVFPNEDALCSVCAPLSHGIYRAYQATPVPAKPSTKPTPQPREPGPPPPAWPVPAAPLQPTEDVGGLTSGSFRTRRQAIISGWEHAARRGRVFKAYKGAPTNTIISMLVLNFRRREAWRVGIWLDDAFEVAFGGGDMYFKRMNATELKGSLA